MVAIVGEVVELRRAGSSIKGLCPFHDEKTPSFTINPANKVYYCHGCQAGGDVISFVREIHGQTYVEALEFLADRAGVSVPREEMSPAEQRRQKDERSQRGRLLALNVAAQSFFVAQLRTAAGAVGREYVRDRGLDPQTCETFGLGVAPDSFEALLGHLRRNGFQDADIEQVGLAKRSRSGSKLYDRFRNRLMFPVYQGRGDIVAFGGRQLGDDKDVAKYMNSPEADLTEVEARHNSALWKFYKKSNCVFGLVQARRGIRKHQYAVIVEGNLDVMMLHQAGLDCTVCPMGTALTEGQLREIKRFTDRVVLMFDGDTAGRRAALKSVPPILTAGLDGVRVELPAGEDPDSYVRKHGIEALQRLIDNAPALLESYIDAHVAEWDGSIAGKSKLLQQVGPVLATIPDPMARDMARDYLGTRVHGSDIEANRPALDRYIRQTKPAGRPAAAPRPRPADVLAAIPSLELELVRVCIWHPGLLSELVRKDMLRFVRHPGLSHVLAELAAKVDPDETVHRPTLSALVHGMDEGPIRSVLLALLVEQPHISEDNAAACLEQVLDQLEIAHLRASLALLIQRSQAGGDGPALEQWARQMVGLRRRIEVLKQPSGKRRNAVRGRDNEEVIHV